MEKVRFETGLKTAEDRLFLFETFLRAQTMYCMPDIFYHYYQNENSVIALQQIDDRMYAKEYEDDYDQILCYGISFFKKRCMVKKK